MCAINIVHGERERMVRRLYAHEMASIDLAMQTFKLDVMEVHEDSRKYLSLRSGNWRHKMLLERRQKVIKANAELFRGHEAAVGTTASNNGAKKSGKPVISASINKPDARPPPKSGAEHVNVTKPSPPPKSCRAEKAVEVDTDDDWVMVKGGSRFTQHEGSTEDWLVINVIDKKRENVEDDLDDWTVI